jgi:hypothetical protein
MMFQPARHPPQLPSKKGESAILSETASCINIRNLIKFGMEEVLKNDMKGVALRHRVR